MTFAIIVTSLVSLFDASIPFQTKICKQQCKSLGKTVIDEIKLFGYVNKKTLSSNKCVNLYNNNIDTIIFYQIKQLTICIKKLYKILMKNRVTPIKIYFARDYLVFGGIPPSFKTVTINLKIRNRKKIKKFINLINNTNDTTVIKNFVNDNFGNVDLLLKIVKENVLWVTILLSNKNNSRLNIIKFNNFISKIKKIDAENNKLISEICNDLKLIKI
ncbi:hypothetical protein [Tanapox virus]|uniref:Protein OPG061 n=2 Tax=Tanapox virus TaxID=99000 RepID=A7XCE3_9POXV|nr:30L protein [Yaba-like disease virus]ABQ43504.1 hypothetical protein [Tanapox virus]ABQ43659.1 hypothetical protein [Tanapox virus]CAC21268.1 30L protein [Yaba-like disease virus]